MASTDERDGSDHGLLSSYHRSNIADEAEEKEEVETEEQIEIRSSELRRELDDLLERTAYILGLEEEEQAQLPLTPEEQFVVLISNYSKQVIQRTIIQTYPSDPTSSLFSGRLPIHLACDKNAPLSIIQYLLDADESKQTLIKPDNWGDLPIHTACSRKDSYDVIELLLQNDTSKTSILTKDDNGLLPLHMACRYNAPPEVIQMLLDNDIYCKDALTAMRMSTNNNNSNYHPFLTPPKRSLLQQDKYGQLPIHTACRCDASPDVIKLLLKGDSTQSSIMKQDAAERFPLHVALLRTRNEKTLELLLNAMIVHRMELVGYDTWKIHMQYMIHHMSTIHERDFMTSDKLQTICDVLKTQLLDRTHILELVMWKANWVQFCPQTYNSIHKEQTPSNLESSSSTQNDDDDKTHDYKTLHRITSGAEIIIRGVIPFLEHEPIETLLPMLT